ncbi:hypothetical protein QZH41_003313 [Actinostola sp. cb2023]|nr:hypothetical protein QZH41_003313 [Actinostola sp. cb2023]
MEAFFRLMWIAFIQWYNSSDTDKQVEEEDLLQKRTEGISVVEQKGNVRIKVIVANARHINLKELLSYELSSVPCALAYNDGSLRKTTKSVLSTVIEKGVNIVSRLPVSPQQIVYIIDGMATVQMTKSAGASLFGDLSLKYFEIFTAPLSLHNCLEVHVVFDQYLDMSIKAGERSRRGASNALEVQIASPSTPVPKQWGKYISNPKNKINLCDYLTKSLCKLGQEKLAENKAMVIGGGIKDGERCVLITRGNCSDVVDLKSNHEEADTRLLLHVKHVSHAETRIVIQSPDTDVLVISTAHFDSLGCEELWFRTGVKDRLRFIPVHEVCRSLGQRMCSALPACHALTGCDSISALAGIGKKKAWNVLCRNHVHQETLSMLGEEHELDENIAAKCESFVCDLYPSLKRTPETTDELRYLMFCQKRQTNETLPPISDSVRQHIMRANYQTYVWRKSLDAMQDLPPPEGHGWKIEDSTLKPMFMTKEPAPKSLLELTTLYEEFRCQQGTVLSVCTLEDISSLSRLGVERHSNFQKYDNRFHRGFDFKRGICSEDHRQLL